MPILTPPDERYHIFISHSQQDGGDQVGHIKKELEKYVETINIFTDVAAGRVERALSAKTELYTAIERSSVFLVFLSKTYFTRKWCVKEFQEAIATGKHIVIVLDTDTRHGGMSLDAFVEYSTKQRDRADADKVRYHLGDRAKRAIVEKFFQRHADLGADASAFVARTGTALCLAEYEKKRHRDGVAVLEIVPQDG